MVTKEWERPKTWGTDGTSVATVTDEGGWIEETREAREELELKEDEE